MVEMNKRQKKIRNLFDMTLTFLFVAVILLPLLSRILPIEPGVRLEEKRIPAGQPEFKLSFPDLWLYPDKFDSYYRDNFSFRSSLVHLFGRIRSRIPGLIVGHQVLVGRDGWYFITQNRTMDDFRGVIRLSPWELEKIKDTLEERKEWLAMSGIKYLLVIAPAKWEIYPEKVPGHLNRVSDQTVLDQIISFLRDHASIELLDLRRPLRELKSFYPVFYRTDTHWNSIGLFAAVQEIKKKLAEWVPGITTDRLEDYEIRKEQEYRGDLARMMGLEGTVPREKYTLVGKNGEVFPPQIPPLGNSLGQILAFDGPFRDRAGVRAVIFHDSFGMSFHLYLRDSFARSVYSWRSMPDIRLIIRERPDVVIQELAQRHIADTLAHNPPGIAGPNSILAGKTAQFHCPVTYRLKGFKAQALCGLPVRQYISLLCNGKKIFEWPLEEEEMGYAVPEHAVPSDQNLLAYSFAYRYDPSLPSDVEDGLALPFGLLVESGGSRNFIGINGSELTWRDGYNIYHISPEGRILQALNFGYTGSGKKSFEMARFVEKAKKQKGFLLLFNQHLPGRTLAKSAQQALHSIGLRAYAKDRRQWNHIALVDLGSKRVIVERSGPAPQRLVLGNYRADAGFRVRALHVTKDTE